MMKMIKMMKWVSLGLVVLCCVCFMPEAARGTLYAAAAPSVVASSVAVSSSAAPIKVVLDGTEMQFDVQPMLINDRTMVPMRAIFEALGAMVFWDDANRIVTAIKGADVIKTQIGFEYLGINGHGIKMDVAPVEVNGRTLVPARFISEALGCYVVWDELNNTVRITSDKNTPPYELAEKLLANQAKIINFGRIAHYNDQIYAAEYLCMPGWNPVKTNVVEAFALLNDKIYRTVGNNTGIESTSMYSSSLDGSNEVFIDLVENWGFGTYIIGDRLVYTRFETDEQTIAGMRIFDTITSSKIDLPIYGNVISFDDEFLYLLVDKEYEIGTTAATEYWRAKWDGSVVGKANNLNGISARYFDSHSSSRDGEVLYFLASGHIAYRSEAGYYSDGVMGISIISVDGLKWTKYLALATNNDARAGDQVFIHDGWVYYNIGSIIYKKNIDDETTIKLCDMHSDIQYEYIWYVDIYDGYIYLHGLTGGNYGPNTALFKIPVNGGTMERTDKAWFES